MRKKGDKNNMKLNYVMDISEKSFSFSHTPGIQSQRLPFYVHNCGHFYSQSSYFTEREGLDNYLLIYTISGRGYLKYKDVNYNLEPNQAVIFYCNEPQFYKTASQEPWEFKWLHLNGTAIVEYYNIINGDSLNVVFMGEHSKISEKFDTIFQTITDNTLIADIKINSVLTAIITEITVMRHSSLNNKKYYQHKAEIDKVISFIKENYNRKITIEELTTSVFISKYYFLRLFKASIGQSPCEYLINYRINVAKYLLKTSELSVSEICYRVGFADANNFIRYFKKLVGVTPLYYRKYWVI